MNAAFTVSDSTICAGQSVQFTDQSLGNPTSWNWIFEGGTPAVSSLQNPTVTYNTPGLYNVTLTVTRGSFNSVAAHPNMIQVDSPLTEAPSQPNGPTDICGLFNYDYATTAVPFATAYQWITDPVAAGIFTGNGLTGTLTASNTWQGTFDVKVAAVNSCGPGPQSVPLSVDLHLQPNPYFLFGGGGYCPGLAGYEVKLEDSDLGVDYELFHNGVTTGLILSGTGNALSFGLQPAGTYTVIGTAGSCSAEMNGSCIVYEIDLPGQASTPTGPADVCSNETSAYAATFPANAFSLTWDLTPPEAGTITTSGLSATINWSGTFSGIASLSVSGENECGTGTPSNPLLITVHSAPYPVITGDTLVCLIDQTTFEVPDNPGSTYNWTVTGGLIVSGQGLYQISVLWGAPGTGTIQVTESTDSGCSGSSEIFDVTIEICPGIPETGSSSVSIYPNPTTSQLVIVKNSTDYIFTSYRISELSLGRMMLQDQLPDMQDPAVIEVGNLANGTYLLTFTSKQGITINKYFSVLR